MTPRFTLRAPLAAALLAAATLAAQAQTTTAPGAAPARASAPAKADAALERSDRRFVEEAAVGGMAEVEMAKLAQQKARHEQVRQFAARMLQDHGKANDELMQLARAKGLTPPGELPAAKRRELGQMERHGNDFDREYMSHMVGDHRKTVEMFRDAARSARDADVKAFAAKTLPTLEEHLRMAQATHDAVRNTTR